MVFRNILMFNKIEQNPNVKNNLHPEKLTPVYQSLLDGNYPSYFVNFLLM